ncbi:MAG: tar3, partial [Burkholderiaceae bacterium]|nr:tar3 [Burkholderiaceae bacterium]
TAASHEQSDGIEQVNQAVSQMDQVTQQNAALVEEAAAAAESLQDQAANLVQVVSVFRTGHEAKGNVIQRAPAKAISVTPAVKTVAKPVAQRSMTSSVPAPTNNRSIVATATDSDWEQF